jgi:hypothetical protein
MDPLYKALGQLANPTESGNSGIGYSPKGLKICRELSESPAGQSTEQLSVTFFPIRRWIGRTAQTAEVLKRLRKLDLVYESEDTEQGYTRMVWRLTSLGIRFVQEIETEGIV